MARPGAHPPLAVWAVSSSATGCSSTCSSSPISAEPSSSDRRGHLGSHDRFDPFEPWKLGEVRHAWEAIGTPTQDVSWISVRGGEYLLFRTADGYRLYGLISCAGKAPSKMSATADGYAVLDCPDGSSWEMDPEGASGGGGDAGTNDPPPEWLVVTAHDGTLIAFVIPGYFPPGTGGAG